MQTARENEWIAPIPRQWFAAQAASAVMQSSESECADFTGQSGPPMASGPQALLQPARPDETVSAQAFHMVERRDFWHAIVDLALRRVGGRRRAGQPLLPHPRRQDRSLARLRAALGDL